MLALFFLSNADRTSMQAREVERLHSADRLRLRRVTQLRCDVNRIGRSARCFFRGL
jgi:hypothetical protein